MTLKNLAKAPFPWFGGKTHAAPSIWAALGDCHHYVEPFMGSLATLLLRPHPCNRTYYSETVNDLDYHLVNFWRAVQASPEETAKWASWPVSEADVHARHLWLIGWVEGARDRMIADPAYFDAKAAGFWVYGQCAWIGSGWCSGKGPWTIVDGKLVKQPKAKRGAREPGVDIKRPHIANCGQGINRPQAREPGVGEFHDIVMPEILRWFRFLSARLRHVRILHGDWSRACTNGATKTLSVQQKKDAVCGIFLDPPYANTASRTDALYAQDSFSVAHNVREWCLANGDDQKLRIVLAGFEGEHGTSLTDAGWREAEWYKSGFLRGGMGNVGSGGQQKRERLWLSPHCLHEGAQAEPDEESTEEQDDDEQLSMF